MVEKAISSKILVRAYFENIVIQIVSLKIIFDDLVFSKVFFLFLVFSNFWQKSWEL